MWSLVGIADDEGVKAVGGRVGAKEGPKAFRALFNKFKLSTMVDGGDHSLSDHHKLADIIANVKTDRTVIVGGGHDHIYSQLLGLSRKFKTLGCINIDAHLDVRKPGAIINSGSGFYMALEEKLLKPENLIEFGIQDHCNSPELWKYIEEKKVPVIAWPKLRFGQAVTKFEYMLDMLAERCEAIVISLDLDSVGGITGVSAPQSEGFSSSEIIAMMEIAKKCKQVCSLGIFELNPLHDIGDITARLAATAAWHFVA